MDTPVSPAERVGSRLFFPFLLVRCMTVARCGGPGSSDSDSCDGDDSYTAGTSPVEVSWERPQERKNGDAMRGGRIDRYEVAYGTDSGDYDTFEETTNTSMTIEGLDEGEEYFFAGRIYDAEGRASFMSQPIS